MKNSFIGCTSTVPNEMIPTKDMILDAFERRAILLLDGDDSRDLIIPIVLNEPKDDDSIKICASLSNIGMVPFRVIVEGDEPLTVDQVYKECRELTDLVNRADLDFELGVIFYIGRLDHEENYLSIAGKVFALIDFDCFKCSPFEIRDDILELIEEIDIMYKPERCKNP